MNKTKKIGIALLALAMCVCFGVSVWALNSNGVTYTATVDQETLCLTETEQTVTLTVKTNQKVDLDSLTAKVVLPDGWSVASIANSDLDLSGSVNGNKIVWWSPINHNTDLLATVTVKVPADVKAGTYTLQFDILSISSDYGTPWEDGATATATVKVAEHAWSISGYTNNGDTHVAHYVCTNNANHTKSDDPAEHDFANGDCPCGAVALTVTKKGNSISYTVEGRVVTVTCASACKVGYLSGDKYVTTGITKTKISDNSYSFTIPAGVNEVLIVVKGDANGDGRINVADKSQVNAVALRQTTLDAAGTFAADVNGDNRINVADKSQVNAVALRQTAFAW